MAQGRYRTLIRFESVGLPGDDTAVAVVPGWDPHRTFKMPLPSNVANVLRGKDVFPVRARAVVNLGCKNPEGLTPSDWDLGLDPEPTA